MDVYNKGILTILMDGKSRTFIIYSPRQKFPTTSLDATSTNSWIMA